MAKIVIFFVEMTIISILLYLLYYTLFREKASFIAQRVLLISIPVVAIVSASISFRGIELRGYGGDLLSEIIVDDSHQPQVESINRSVIETDEFRIERTNKRPFTIEYLAISIWVSIAILLSILFAYRLIKIRSMRRAAQSERRSDYTIYKLDIDGVLFSFCRGVYISKSVDSERLYYVMQHELAHIRNSHYVDKLIVEALSILIWFNPIIRLIQQELSLIHEYEADNAVIESGADVRSYKMFIFEAVASSVPCFANGINSSQIKKRFIAMKTSYHTSHKLLRACMTLFVFVAIAATSVMYVEAKEPPRSIINEIPPQDITSVTISKGDVTIVKKDGTVVSYNEGNPLKVNIDNSSEKSTPQKAPSVDAERDQLFVTSLNRKNEPIYVVRCEDHTKVYIGMRVLWDRHWCVLSEDMALIDPKTQNRYMLHSSGTGLPLEKLIWVKNLKDRYVYYAN